MWTGRGFPQAYLEFLPSMLKALDLVPNAAKKKYTGLLVWWPMPIMPTLDRQRHRLILVYREFQPAWLTM